MNIVAIDDEKLALEALSSAIKNAEPEAVLHTFRDAGELLEFAGSNPIDIAFLDIELCGINGLELAKMLKEICPMVNIIFVTGYDSYTLEAFSIRASGYLLKPVTEKSIIHEMENLRNPVPEKHSANKLRIHTFGNFEAFLGEEPLHFGRSKSKELLAYLVDRRGASCSMEEISAILWEDRPYDRTQLKKIHTCIAELKNVLRKAAVLEVLVKKRNSISINVDAVDCDYYKFLQGDVRTINSFTGEYMTNYSWAEFTVGSLSRIATERKAREFVFD